MKHCTRVITVNTERGPQFIDITDRVQDAIDQSAIRNGFAVVYSRHTTAAIRINENEPLLLQDMESFLERVAPPSAFYNHNDMDHRTVNLTEEEDANGHAHCQQLLLGASETVPVVDGAMLSGRWQRIFLVELDRGRPREVIVQLVGE